MRIAHLLIYIFTIALALPAMALPPGAFKEEEKKPAKTSRFGNDEASENKTEEATKKMAEEEQPDLKTEKDDEPDENSAPEKKTVTAPEWETMLDFDAQLFPSYLISTATSKPNPDDEKDPTVLGDEYGLIGISIAVPNAKAKAKVTVKQNKLMEASVWEGEIPTAHEIYFVSPKIAYDFDVLRTIHQQKPINITIEVEVDGKPVGSKTVTATVRSINDCPFAVAHSEEMGSDNSGYDDMGWMFAAYVNESHPWIDRVLKDALKTGVVNAFTGYQTGDPDQVKAQIFAIWDVFHKRGVKYSSITATPGGSKLVFSQHVRFLEESSKNNQANCVDGSVLFASILRKIGLQPFLVIVPGHMYLGVYLDPKQEEFIGLETTLIGASQAPDSEAVAEMVGKFSEENQKLPSLKTYGAAVEIGTGNLERHAGDFADDEKPEYQLIDIAEARKDGVMPIPYE